MLSANSRLSLAVLLAVFCHAQAVEPPLHNNKPVDGLNDETRCSWNCTVTDSDFSEEMKTTIAKKKMIGLVVKYEKGVTEKCVNQTSHNSSGNITEHWQIWLPSKQLSVFAKALENVANLMFGTDSNGDREEIRATCTLRPVNMTATDPTYYSGSFPIFSRSHLADLGVKFDSIDCNTETTDNLEPCINITKSTGNRSTNSKSPFERGGWPSDVLSFFCFVFLAVFVHYSPAFLCLFSPTEVTKDGVRQIILEGASPVSVRSLMGNYFFPEDDGTIWHKARKFCVRVVVMPLPFLGPAIFADFMVLGFLRLYFFQRFVMICCGCYFIQAFYISFFTARSVQAKPCIVCKLIKPKTFSCQDEIPQLIVGHLRVQPFILVQSWRLFIQYILRYCKMSLAVLPTCKVSFVNIFCVPIYMIFLSTIPAVTMILLIVIILLAFGGIILSSPVVILSLTRNSAINVPSFVDFVVRYCWTFSAAFGALYLLVFAGIGTTLALLVGFQLLFSEDSLPYVACFVLVLYYAWSSYSSFTNKYQDLAFTLFNHYKKSQDQKFDATALNSSDQVQGNIGAEYEDIPMKIPKELFRMACEELMPIRNNVCVLILRVTIIVSFVFLAFLTAMLIKVGATPVMKALLTFLTGIVPKIVAIYIDGGRQRKIEAMITHQKIPKILREYFKKASRSCQGCDNYGADVNETLPQNVNEENIELVIM